MLVAIQEASVQSLKRQEQASTDGRPSTAQQAPRNRSRSSGRTPLPQDQQGQSSAVSELLLDGLDTAAPAQPAASRSEFRQRTRTKRGKEYFSEEDKRKKRKGDTPNSLNEDG